MKVVPIAELMTKVFSYKIIRYAFVGGISTLIHVLIASLYIHFISSSVFQSNILGFLIAYFFSYLVQTKYVFEHEISKEKAIKYFIVQFCALLIAILASDTFNTFNSYVRTLIVVFLMPLITFLIHKFWTFKE